MEEISQRLYRHLNGLGYGWKIIRIRRNMKLKLAAVLKKHHGRKIVISGSNGEGIANSYESDMDALFFMPTSVCITHQEQSLLPGVQYVFRAINTSPGHCVLKLLKRGVKDLTIEDASVPLNGDWYLSSEVFRKEIQRAVTSTVWKTQMSGPAHSITVQSGFMYDKVYTITCVCPTIVNNWALRPRRYDWLPPLVRLHAATMNGNLVATGTDASPTKHLEWRYCFNEIELLLMEYLNDTQLKLYKVLKVINNDILKPAGFTITSYMMKNVVFWLAESYPQTMFVPETLFQCVLEALKMLKHSVEINDLQYYMIPERNLMTEKVKETDRVPLQMKLSELIHSGPAVLLQCKTLHRVMNLTIPELGILQHKIELLEMCDLYCSHRSLLFKRETDKETAKKDPLIHHLFLFIIQILKSGWTLAIQQEINKCNSLEEARKLLFR